MACLESVVCRSGAAFFMVHGMPSQQQPKREAVHLRYSIRGAGLASLRLVDPPSSISLAKLADDLASSKRGSDDHQLTC